MLNWYAVYTKPRHEFVVHGELFRKRIDTFLPTYRSLRQWKDRNKWIDAPLFPGYIFVRIMPEPDAFHHVLKTRSVVSFVKLYSSSPVPVPEDEMSSLRIILESGLPFDVYPHLTEGVRIKVVKGPLSGAEGVIVKKQNPCMLQVNIDILSRSVAIELCADYLEAA